MKAMRNFRPSLTLLTILACLEPATAHAYLDPATGGMLLTATFGIATTLFFILKGIYFRAIDLGARLLGRAHTSKRSYGIVFYSEGTQYWDVFSPILKSLSERGVPCCYLTSSAEDPGLRCSWPGVETRCIGFGTRAFLFLNTLEADVVVMTTPGLDVLQIQRSKGVKRYVHVTHSAGGCAGYPAFGLDYFDSVLVSGLADKLLLEELERKRPIGKKRIDIVGCTYLDVRKDELKTFQPRTAFPGSTRRKVLISPTWGDHGLLAAYGKQLLETLRSDARYDLIVRPHSHTRQYESGLLQGLREQFPEGAHLHWDFEDDGLHSLSEADIMLSDVSGIIFDFLFLFGRPVLVFNSQYRKAGKEAMFLDQDPWNLRILEKVGRVLQPADVAGIGDLIASALASDNDFKEGLAVARMDMWQHPGESGRRAADAILDLS
jgi:hypothetical protein